MNSLSKAALLTGTMILAAPISAMAQDWELQFGAGLTATNRSSSDTDIEGDPFYGGYLEGYAAQRFGDYRLAFDGFLEGIDNSGADGYDESGPQQAGVIGAHFGRYVGEYLIGAYVGIGMFDGEEENTGWVAGIEAERALGNGTLFAQVGHVEANGNWDDNQFNGPNVRIGYQGAINDRWSAMGALEWAHSDDFEDEGDSGTYWGLEAGVAYALKEDWDVVGTLRLSDIKANTEDDAKDNAIYIGFRKTFGKKPSSGLRTPVGGFRAGGWAEQLD